MNIEELTKLIEEAEELNNKGNFVEAESLINKLLVEKILDQDLLLKSKALLILSTTLWRQGKFTESLPIAEKSLECSISTKATNAITSTKYEAKALNLIGVIYNSLSDYHNALDNLNNALYLLEELKDKSGVAFANCYIGIVYHTLSDFKKALEFYFSSLSKYEEISNKNGIAFIIGNIGCVYGSLSDYQKALEYFNLALALHEEIDDKRGVATVTKNIGFMYFKLSNFLKAIEFYDRSIAIYLDIGDKNGVASVYSEIGHVFYNLQDYTKAQEYFNHALTLSEEIGDIKVEAIVISYIGALRSDPLFEDGLNYDKAEEYLLKAAKLNSKIGIKEALYNNYKSLSQLYETLFRWDEALTYFKLFHELEKEVLSEETKKKAELFDIQRKQADIDKQLAIERAKHEATETLLHNVLPISIANRIINGENLIAEKLSNVSVLFADIVNFTKLSQSITPEQLVDGLDRIFTAFDLLADKYNLEKIKTIGDAYMVVAGAPLPRNDHAQAMANMAIDMIEAMKQFTSITTGEPIQIRIGIHSGEVVAGVIGKKKFAYDLWGDAVNTASRMESHGEPNQIHISQDFYNELISSNLFSIDNFIDRGKMEIKGKGVLKTYFLIKS
ncbi:MAG: tetratricopeptide repeat protein [Chlorobiota bacterium]|nr:MAG: tetratricopeptide repeat protein [Chlorobiota bacterium]